MSGKRSRDIERRLDALAWLILGLICGFLVITSALFRKGVLSAKDLVADA